MKKLKIVITGASGFVGQHLLEDLQNTGHSIRVITRDPSKKINNLPAGTEIVKADLTDFLSLRNAFSGADVLVNIAAEVRNHKLLEETNIAGTKNIIKAAYENKVAKIIHLSSVGVVGKQYSNSLTFVDEEAECFPKNEYERTKLESERLFIEASQKNDFLLTILRPTNVFGERHPFNALHNLIDHINSQKVTMCSKSAIVNYVYVKDLTGIIVQLINDEKEHGTVNVGNSHRLPDFIKRIADLLGKHERILFVPQLLINLVDATGIKKIRSVSNQVVYKDEKLKTFYQYPYGIEKGLERTIEYYKKQNLIK